MWLSCARLPADRVLRFSLKRRLEADYGFQLSLKYEDGEGDLIDLATQNDFNELLRSELTTVHVR